MRKIFFLLLAFAAITAFAIFGVLSRRSSVVTGKIVKAIESLAGVPVEVEGIHLKGSGPVDPHTFVTIDKVRIKGPAEFTQTVLAEISGVEFELDYFSLLTGKWNISSLKVPVDRINLEINSKAKFNLGAVPVLTGDSLKKNNAGDFVVHKMEFQIKKVYFYDYRAVLNPEPEEYSFSNPMEVYTEVRSPEVLIQAPALQLLYQLNKGSLGLSRDKIQEAVTQNTGKTTA